MAQNDVVNFQKIKYTIINNNNGYYYQELPIKKNPKISCSAGILPANHKGRQGCPSHDQRIIYYLKVPNGEFLKGLIAVERQYI